MSDKEISPKALGIITDFATLGGIVLGFKAIGDAIINGGSIPWAVIGAFVSIVSALGIYSDVLDFLGDWQTAKVRRQIGGSVIAVIVAAIALLLALLSF